MISGFTEAAILDCFNHPKIRRKVEEIVKEVILRILSGQTEPAIPFGQRAIAKTCEAYGVTPKMLLGRERHRAATEPRQVAAWVMRAHGMSFPVIARFLGGRDHTTIMDACKSVAKRENVLVKATEIFRQTEGAP